MLSKIRSFLTDDSGATAIEYGLIAALVSVGAITALSSVGDALANMFTEASSQIDSAVAS